MFEISVVTAPANQDTRFISMKSIEDRQSVEDLEARCRELGVLPSADEPQEKAVRPIKVASFDC